MRPLIIIASVLAGVGLLYWRFPYALDDSDSIQRLIYLVLLLLIILLGGGAVRQQVRRKALKQGLVWLGIMLALVFAYSFRDVFSERVLGELLPHHVRLTGDGEIMVRASEGGHFYMEALVNGARVRFMVDTGASDIVLSPKDAERAGFDTTMMEFNRTYQTANGFGSGAGVTLRTLEVGDITLRDVKASVNKADMGSSLLGMAFLRRFSRFEVRDNTLVLKP